MLIGGDRVAACRQRQPIDRADQIHRGQVQHTVGIVAQVGRGLRAFAHADHAKLGQPPRRRNGREVGRAVLVLGGDQHDGCAEVQNAWVDGLVHGSRPCVGWVDYAFRIRHPYPRAYRMLALQTLSQK